jgi:Raf kinase inhibitor-like YbhB/YbcL family protein
MEKTILAMKYLFIILVSFAAFTGEKKQMTVTSKAFTDHGTIPAKYTCAGENVNPPLTIRNIPLNTRTLAMIVEHPNTPAGDVTEWIAWDIIPDGVISENTRPGWVGNNSKGMREYNGPCAQGVTGLHTYRFKVYALDKRLCLKKGSDRAALETAMTGHILATSELVGTFGTDTTHTTPVAPNVDR